MKITIFTSNQPRHRALVVALAGVADRCHAVMECKTVFPGRVAGFYAQSETMQRYFARVLESEARMFGEARFVDHASVLPMQRGDLSLLSRDQLSEAMDADLFVCFGSSIIKGWLAEELVRRRAINLHMGLSPYYRGSSTNFWALADGNPHMVGATVHLLSSGVDTGDILFHAVPDPEGCADAFGFMMASVREAQRALVARVADGTISTIATVAQDPALEVRYSRNREFTDEIAAEFLAREPSIDEIRAQLEQSSGSVALIG
jgi:hypothetical protein